MKQYVCSNSWLIKEAPKNAQMLQKFQYASDVPIDQLAVVILGGALTTNDRAGYGYIQHIAPVVAQGGGANVFCAIYDFQSLDPMLVKANVFRKNGKRYTLDEDKSTAIRKEDELKQIYANEPIPGYILDLYDTLFDTRIVPDNPKQTIANFRNLIFYTHCHGGVALCQLSDLLEQGLKDAGFSENHIQTIMKNVVAIQHNPTGPLHGTKFTTVNFASVSDDTLNWHDDISKQILKQDTLVPTYVDKVKLFVAGKLKIKNGAEHGFSDGYKNEPGEKRLTDNGKIIFGAEQNALKNAVRAVHNHQPVPSPEILVSGDEITFSETFNHSQNPKPDYQR